MQEFGHLNYIKQQYSVLPLNMTYLHCLQHSLFEHLLNLYCSAWFCFLAYNTLIRPTEMLEWKSDAHTYFYYCFICTFIKTRQNIVRITSITKQLNIMFKAEGTFVIRFSTLQFMLWNKALNIKNNLHLNEKLKNRKTFCNIKNY